MIVLAPKIPFPALMKPPHYYSNDEQIVIIRDLEKTPCYSELINELSIICPGLPIDRTNSIFAKYNLEHLYLSDIDVFKSAFHQIYRTYFQRDLDNNELDELISGLNQIRPNFKIIFRKYGIAFNKRKLANEFFARFDFEKSDHPYFVRLLNTLRGVL